MDMNHRGGMWEGEGGKDGVEWGWGGWDNCNSIINKYIEKKKPQQRVEQAPLLPLGPSSTYSITVQRPALPHPSDHLRLRPFT